MRIKEKYVNILEKLGYSVKYNPKLIIYDKDSERPLSISTDERTGIVTYSNSGKEIRVMPSGEFEYKKDGKTIIRTNNGDQETIYESVVYDYNQNGNIDCQICTMVSLPKEDVKRLDPSKISISVKNGLKQPKTLTILQLCSHVDIICDKSLRETLDNENIDIPTIIEAIKRFINESKNYSSTKEAQKVFGYAIETLEDAVNQILNYWLDYDIDQAKEDRIEFQNQDNIARPLKEALQRDIDFLSSTSASKKEGIYMAATNKYNRRILEKLGCNIVKSYGEIVNVQVGESIVSARVLYNKENQIIFLSTGEMIIADAKTKTRVVSSQNENGMVLDIYNHNNRDNDNNPKSVRITVNRGNDLYLFDLFIEQDGNNVLNLTQYDTYANFNGQRIESEDCSVDKHCQLLLNFFNNQNQDMLEGVRIVYPAIYQYISSQMNRWVEFIADSINAINRGIDRENAIFEERTKEHEQYLAESSGKLSELNKVQERLSAYGKTAKVRS